VATLDDDVLLGNVFEERAEFLSAHELNQWTATTTRDRAVLVKLKGPGPKLLIGPRGCGKSTLLRQALFEMQDERKDLAVYVNYSRSLALEPLFHRVANALQLFRQWVLMRIVVGVSESLSETGLSAPGLSELAKSGRTFIRDLEAGNADALPDRFITPTELLRLLEEWTRSAHLRRCVLLLDDAAHAFSPDQQREFFEIYRELRSRYVSAKAAVYPGITSYSPNFHVGHEAELVEAWYRPDADDYLDVMREIVHRRLPLAFQEKLRGREELVDYLALSSFGLPRGFLVMLSQLLGVEENEGLTPTRKNAERAIADYAASVRNIFSSLASKLPRYRNFVEIGSQLASAATRAIQAFNVEKSLDRKAVTIAFQDPLDPELSRMLSMLEYAGLVRDAHTVSRGVKGVFHRYTLHYALLLDANSLSLGRSFSVQDAVHALSKRDAHAFVRVSPTRLLAPDYASKCTLDLLPCQNCGAPRLSEDAQFCMRCGRQLSSASIYDELLKTPIDRLPLTPKKLEGIKRHTSIRSVNDVLTDEDNQILSVPWVGPVWSRRIKQYAEEFVSV
jgi:ABC-type hemin transport system ATPase subunit